MFIFVNSYDILRQILPRNLQRWPSRPHIPLRTTGATLITALSHPQSLSGGRGGEGGDFGLSATKH